MDAAREMVNSHRRMGQSVCIPVIFLEGENEGGGIGYFAAEVHCNATQCQTKISAQSPEKIRDLDGLWTG